MNCQWQSSCSNEGTSRVYRALSQEESDSLAHGEGIIWSIPKYHHKLVCDDCLDAAKQTYSVSQEQIDADPDLSHF